MGTEAGRAAGLYRGSNTEQGIGVLGWLRFAPCGCVFLVEAGSKKAESFSFSLLPVSGFSPVFGYCFIQVLQYSS